MKRSRIADCLDFINSCSSTTVYSSFEEVEPPHGECYCATVEDLIDLEDRYEKQTDGAYHQ